MAFERYLLVVMILCFLTSTQGYNLKYKKGSDSVLLVTKEDYFSCNTKSPVQSLTEGDSIFTFDRSGPFFFITGNADNCNKGQKLSVVVMAVRHKPPQQQPQTESPKASDAPSDSVDGVPAPSSEQKSGSFRGVCSTWLVLGFNILVGNSVKLGMSIPVVYKTTLSTWASWVENTIDANRTLVFFRTFEPSHWSHWCLPELPDVWNEIFLLYLLADYGLPADSVDSWSSMQSCNVPLCFSTITFPFPPLENKLVSFAASDNAVLRKLRMEVRFGFREFVEETLREKVEEKKKKMNIGIMMEKKMNIDQIRQIVEIVRLTVELELAREFSSRVELRFIVFEFESSSVILELDSTRLDPYTRPSDLQSNALPTELSRHMKFRASNGPDTYILLPLNLGPPPCCTSHRGDSVLFGICCLSSCFPEDSNPLNDLRGLPAWFTASRFKGQCFCLWSSEDEVISATKPDNVDNLALDETIGRSSCSRPDFLNTVPLTYGPECEIIFLLCSGKSLLSYYAAGVCLGGAG
ncbi:Early nodulin-like protein 1 [Hibiscus syriacus]|uniref:Early nodulin-like protein 1 n=1 Tax=Hibiscus syriacus TaxID=106335 RepID=A0A6A3BIP4_HIBSY|nr:Early nodulin-like protein 1 [Hibiscus syriacus]